MCPSSEGHVMSPFGQVLLRFIYVKLLVTWNIASIWYPCDLKKKKNASFLPLVSLYTFDKAKQCIGTMTIEIDFLQKKSIDSNPYDTDKMAAEFIQQFNNQAFSVGQQVVWNFLSCLSLYRHSSSCSCPQLILLFKNERSFAYKQVYMQGEW